MEEETKEQSGGMEPIAAVATAQGRGGIAVIRISGAGALRFAEEMFSHRGEYVPNMLYPGRIDGGTLTDYGMCVYFRAPKSFTGEDAVEFHCHGGTEIARAVLKRAIDLGARMAENGEFTKRAFLNGKLSLSAAEGMAEMINAQSEAQARVGRMLYDEALTKEGRRLQALLTQCLARIDVDLDYPEEDLTEDVRVLSLAALDETKTALAALKEQYRAGKKIKSGVNVVLCGSPNAGKSSLLNALLGCDRAIVSETAGTTRDIVEGAIELRGVLFRLTDTAGLRESGDEIEREGIRRAQAAIDGADVVVWLKDDIFRPDFPSGVPVVTVGAKCDLYRTADCDISVSSVTGEGIEGLKDLIYAAGIRRETDGIFLMTERHYRAVEQAYEAVDRAIAQAEEGLYPELYAEDVKKAWYELGTLSGETATESIVSEIFSKFCVGK